MRRAFIRFSIIEGNFTSFKKIKSASPEQVDASCYAGELIGNRP